MNRIGIVSNALAEFILDFSTKVRNEYSHCGELLVLCKGSLEVCQNENAGVNELFAAVLIIDSYCRTLYFSNEYPQISNFFLSVNVEVPTLMTELALGLEIDKNED